MYSNDIAFRNNVFADARGVAGRGLGFKDTDSVSAEGNVIVRNSVGISIDNSPTTTGVTNRFTDNVIAFNDVGVQLLPSVKANEFRANDFLGNVAPVAVTGGGDALENRWSTNYWSDYAGFDRDHNGLGDSPFVYERLSDDQLAKHEELQVFNLGPAVTALDAMSRVLPFLAPTPILVDSLPRVERRATASDRGAPLKPQGGLAAGLLGMSLVAAALTIHLRRGVGSPR
jgi:nitrous oxidase accessory protein